MIPVLEGRKLMNKENSENIVQFNLASQIDEDEMMMNTEEEQ